MAARLWSLVPAVESVLPPQLHSREPVPTLFWQLAELMIWHRLPMRSMSVAKNNLRKLKMDRKG